MNIAQIRSQMQMLADALCDVESNLARLFESQGPEPTQSIEHSPTSLAVFRPRYVPSDWPRVGGREELTRISHLFSSTAYRDQYRAGELREIYAAAGAGLGRLVALFRLPLYKVSTCSSGRLPARIAELKKDLYACEWFRGGQYIADPDGFDDWFPSHLRINIAPAVNSPVRPAPRAIGVQLPDTMSSREFDRAFDAEVRKGALDLWVKTPEGRRHCAALGVNPAVAQRFTPYPFGAAARRSPVTEIVSFRKHCDPDRLVAIAERVILRHMGLIS